VPARVYSDTLRLRTRETELRVADLPAELDGFRIVQIADLQADGRTKGDKLQAYVDRVNQLKPDLILFAGDLVTSGTDYVETGAEAMGKMESRYGIYACLGDHDFFSNRQMVAASLQKNGVTVLDNVAAIVPVGPSFISIAGITNVYARPRPTPDALEAIEQQRPDAPVDIFLTHQPSPAIVDYATAKGYDLFVAGHTHGGQIVFPLPGFLLTGSSFETRYVTGFYDVGRMLASITNGLGLTLAPIRYHAPAEVTLILLRPRIDL
jgi:predicted MPP superfamily phosphohydrolase